VWEKLFKKRLQVSEDEVRQIMDVVKIGLHTRGLRESHTYREVVVAHQRRINVRKEVED